MARKSLQLYDTSLLLFLSSPICGIYYLKHHVLVVTLRLCVLLVFKFRAVLHFEGVSHQLHCCFCMQSGLGVRGPHFFQKLHSSCPSHVLQPLVEHTGL